MGAHVCPQNRTAGRKVRYAAAMFPRDEEWERVSACEHAINLLDLLKRGQNIDAAAYGTGGPLRPWLIALKAEIETALGEDTAS